MTYSLHPEAEAELMEAAIYLAEHASRKVAKAYLDEFERIAGIVEIYPGLGSPADGGYRVYPFARFKYSLVYFDDVHGLLILAVAPHSREPGYWKSRDTRNQFAATAEGRAGASRLSALATPAGRRKLTPPRCRWPSAAAPGRPAPPLPLNG